MVPQITPFSTSKQINHNFSLMANIITNHFDADHEQLEVLPCISMKTGKLDLTDSDSYNLDIMFRL